MCEVSWDSVLSQPWQAAATRFSLSVFGAEANVKLSNLEVYSGQKQKIRKAGILLQFKRAVNAIFRFSCSGSHLQSSYESEMWKLKETVPHWLCLQAKKIVKDYVWNYKNKNPFDPKVINILINIWIKLYQVLGEAHFCPVFGFRPLFVCHLLMR